MNTPLSTVPAAHTTRTPLSALALIMLFLLPPAQAIETSTDAQAAISPSIEPRRWSLTARWENDGFGGTDRFYTDGISMSLIHTGGGWLNPLADMLPWGTGRRCVGYDFGQIMITPTDKTLVIPDPTDRPYAGILYLGVTLHIDHDNIYHGLKITTGMVGPSSLAENAQKLVHRWLAGVIPQGWDYQIKDEPIFNLTYEHRRKYSLFGKPRGVAVELLPTATVMLGNVLTQAQVGGQFRFGYNIPDDFGKTLLRGMGHLPPPRLALNPNDRTKFGFYFYGGVHGSLVLRDITLDGNTWKDSRSVDKKTLVPSAEVGLVLAARQWVFGFSYVFVGQEFEGQGDHTEFGAMTFTHRF